MQKVKVKGCLEEVPYCFSRSFVKFQGDTALKIVEFDPDWAFPDCNRKYKDYVYRKMLLQEYLKNK